MQACRSLALDGVIGELCTTDGLLKVPAVSNSGGLLEGLGPDNPGVPECFRVVRDLEESEARACSVAPPIKNPTASVRHTSSERENNERRHRKLKKVLMEQPLFRHRQTWLRQEQLPLPAPWPTRQTYAIRVLHLPTWLAWTHCFHTSPVRTHKTSCWPR